MPSEVDNHVVIDYLYVYSRDVNKDQAFKAKDLAYVHAN